MAFQTCTQTHWNHSASGWQILGCESLGGCFFPSSSLFPCQTQPQTTNTCSTSLLPSCCWAPHHSDFPKTHVQAGTPRPKKGEPTFTGYCLESVWQTEPWLQVYHQEFPEDRVCLVSKHCRLFVSQRTSPRSPPPTSLHSSVDKRMVQLDQSKVPTKEARFSAGSETGRAGQGKYQPSCQAALSVGGGERWLAVWLWQLMI